MNKVYIGYVQGLHGLRGDLKVNEEEHEVTNAKFYKGFYLVTIDNLKDINLVEKYKGYDVYFDREELKLEKGYILEDLYGLTIIEGNDKFGRVKEILDNGVYKILVVDYDREYMIPLIDEYVKDVNLADETIEVSNVRSLIL